MAGLAPGSGSWTPRLGTNGVVPVTHWPHVAGNVAALVLFPTLVLVGGLAGLYTVGRHVGGDTPNLAVGAGATSTVALLVGVGVSTTLEFVSTIGVVATLAAFGGFGVVTAAGSRGEAVVAGLVTTLVVVAPIVAAQWPLATRGGLFEFAVVLYTAATVGLVVLGVPCYLFGLSLGRLRQARS